LWLWKWEVWWWKAESW